MVGLSCASFAYLYGADWQAFFITFLASSVAMFTAFVATVIVVMIYYMKG